MSKEERTDTDKKRERRKKKIKQKVKQKARQDKDKLSDLLQPGMGKKFNKEKMKKTLESVTKSRNVKKVRKPTPIVICPFYIARTFSQRS